TLLTGAEQQLKPQAHSEDRAAVVGHRPDHRVEPAGSQRGRGHGERADPRQHQPVAFTEPTGVAADDHLGATVGEGPLDAAQVANAVVADANHSHSVPLVDGMSSPSTVSAWRVASPSALKAASARWC